MQSRKENLFNQLSNHHGLLKNQKTYEIHVNCSAGYEEIYTAALEQNYKKLWNCLRVVNIDVWKPGAFYYSAGTQLAAEGNKAAVEFLLRNGSNISYVAKGAALSGDKAYANKCLENGALESFVAHGAGLGGKKEYAYELLSQNEELHVHVIFGALVGGFFKFAKELLSKWRYPPEQIAIATGINGSRTHIEQLIKLGFPIDHIASGLFIGGKFKFGEELISRGASLNNSSYAIGASGNKNYILNLGAAINMDLLLQGLSFAGHKQLAQELLDKGATINSLCKFALHGGHMDNLNQSKQLKYLSLFNPKFIPDMIKSFRQIDDPLVIIDRSTESRAMATAKQISQEKLSFPEAFVRTDIQNEGLLFLMMLLFARGNSSFIEKVPCLPLELWHYIFDFIVPIPIKEGWNTLGFLNMRIHLNAQLSCQAAACKERYPNFFQKSSIIENKKDLKLLIKDQMTVQHQEKLQTCANPEISNFHSVVGFWKKMLWNPPIKDCSMDLKIN